MRVTEANDKRERIKSELNKEEHKRRLKRNRSIRDDQRRERGIEEKS
jgi:hypothetical protein